MKTTPTYLIYLFEYKHIIFCIKPIFLSKVKANAQMNKDDIYNVKISRHFV